MRTILSFPSREADGRTGETLDRVPAPELAATLQRLVMVRLQTQQAFERCVHQSEELNRDLDSALTRGQEDLARRLIQSLGLVSLQREALSLQVETMDRQCSRLRSRLSLLFQAELRPRDMQMPDQEPRSDWIDRELHRRKAALASRTESKSA